MDTSFNILQSEQRLQDTMTTFNVTFLQQVCPDNPEFCNEMLMAFRSESSKYMASARMQLLKNDLIAVAKTAHAMKPIGSYIGAENLTILMGQLETSARNLDSANVSEMVTRAEMMVAGINSEITKYLNPALI